MKTQWVWVVTSCGRSGGLDHVSVWVDESEAMEHARGLRRSGGVRSWRAIDDAGTCRLWLPDNTDGSDRRSVSASFVVSDAGGGAVTKVWEVKVVDQRRHVTARHLFASHASALGLACDEAEDWRKHLGDGLGAASAFNVFNDGSQEWVIGRVGDGIVITLEPVEVKP